MGRDGDLGQAGSEFDASDLTTGIGNTVQDNITRLGLLLLVRLRTIGIVRLSCGGTVAYAHIADVGFKWSWWNCQCLENKVYTEISDADGIEQFHQINLH